MSVTRTFTVTVSNPGSGNKYYIDGVLTPTLNLGETGTYKFDQADSSNSSHPLRFATAADAAGGTEYTTGVTSSGTPGNAGAYTQIVVAASAPTLYYYCTNHSGMGGQANTISEDSYGALGWGSNLWGVKEAFTSGWGAETWGTGGSWGQATDEVVALTGLSLTSSVGEPISGSEQGWGRELWGKEPWGDSYSPVIAVTGFGLTSTLGDLAYAASTSGWGRLAWGDNDWDGAGITETLSGLGATSSIGSVTIQDEINTGWGQDGWGVENWGQSGLALELTAPSELTTNCGAGGWGEVSWGNNSWGMFTLNPADVQGLSGQVSTGSVGSISIIVDFTGTLTAPSALTSSIGSLTVNENADMLVGLSGQVLTSSVGAITPADVIGVTGLGLTTGVGSITTDAVDLIDVTGVGATSSVGSITIGLGVPLTGVSATAAVGSITPADVVGLEGLELTSSVGNVSPLGYFDIDITGNTSYNDIDITGNTSYTDVA